MIKKIANGLAWVSGADMVARTFRATKHITPIDASDTEDQPTNRHSWMLWPDAEKRAVARRCAVHQRIFNAMLYVAIAMLLWAMLNLNVLGTLVSILACSLFVVSMVRKSLVAYQLRKGSPCTLDEWFMHISLINFFSFRP